MKSINTSITIPRSRPVRGRGFTLIELLVVISIIALLVGILLPALGAARKSAQNMLCLANERQIGIGCWAYSNDNGGVFPPAWSGASDWGVIINAYMAASGNSTYAKKGDKANTEALQCPSAHISAGRLHYGASFLVLVNTTKPASIQLDPYQPDWAVRASDVMMHGDAAQQYVPNNDTFHGNAFAGLDRLDAFRVDSKADYYFESNTRNDRKISEGRRYVSGAVITWQQADLRYRHPGGDGSVNLLYIDGHASNIMRGEILVRNVQADPPPGLIR